MIANHDVAVWATALGAPEQPLATLLAHLPGMAYRCRQDDCCTMEYVSDGCRALTGYEPSDLIDSARLSFAEIIHADDRERVRREIDAAVRLRRPFHLTYRIVTSGGAVRWVWEKGRALFTASGAVAALEGFIEDVTAHVLAEQRLQSSEAVLAESQRMANVGSWEIDTQSGTCTATAEFWRILGREPADSATFEQYLRLVHPDDQQSLCERLRAIRAERRAMSYDHRIIRADGQIRYVNCRGRLISDLTGHATRLIGTMQDITDRKRDEERMRFLADAGALLGRSLDRDELLRAIASIAVPAIGDLCVVDFVFDGGHRREYAVAGSPDEVHPSLAEGLKLLDPLTPGSFYLAMMEAPRPALLSPVPDAVIERIAGRSPRAGELARECGLESLLMVPLLARDHIFGMITFATLRGRPMLDQRDLELATELAARAGVAIQNAQLFETVRQELAERQRAERERDTTEAFLHAFFESSATYSCVLDIDDETEDWIFVMPNEPYARSYGYTPEAMAGKTARGIGVPEDRIRFFVDVLRRCRDSGEPVSIEISPSKTINKTWRLGNIAPFTLEGRTLLAYVGTDITERKALEQQVIQAQKMEAVALLAGGIAHDFNNLITVISGSAELALEDIPPDHPTRENIVEIKQAADRAGALTRQLLTFSRRQAVRPQVVAVNEIVRHADRMLRRLIGERHELHSVLSPSTPLVYMDPGQLEQLLVNLVVNARDAMPSGGGITVSTATVVIGDDAAACAEQPPAGEYVAIAVQDEGIGMDESIKSRIFEPFFTTKDVGKGTGLGLATVFTIVKAAQGRVCVESAPGRGTTFTVFLPVTNLEANAGIEVRAMPMERATGETILLVEDEPHVRRLARKALSDLGYTVHEASCGAEALRVADALADLDLLVTDVVLPEFDGRELADLLGERRPGLRVLFMSGYATDAMQRVIELPGAFLEKPFNASRLTAAVRDILASRPEWRRSA